MGTQIEFERPSVARLLMQHRIDGVIATNTTLSREGVQNLPHGEESGGLSGAPVRDKSTVVIRQLAAELQGALPIIGVGGILSGSDAAEKIHGAIPTYPRKASNSSALPPPVLP